METLEKSVGANKEELARVVGLMKKSPSYISNGKGYLAKRFNTTEDYILAAKVIVRGGEDMEKLAINLQEDTKSTPKRVLIFDIETAPILGYTFNIWNTNIHTDAIANDWYMLTWAAKWLGEKEIYSDRVTSEESLEENDKRICMSLWNLLDEADIVISYNGHKFDHRKLNHRFIIHRLFPPRPYKELDLLIKLKKVSSGTSNKLDYWNKKLGISRKIENEGIKLWIKCVKGHPASLITMEDDNVGDVAALEELYLEVRPWIENHPTIYTDKGVCPVCGTKNIRPLGEFGKNILDYPIFRCDNCKTVIKHKSSVKVNYNNLRAL